MNILGLWLIWWSIQATFFSLAGLTVYVVVRRKGPEIGSMTAATTLVVLAGVSVLALSPWPHWWTLDGPGARLASREESAGAQTTGGPSLPVEVTDNSETGAPSLGPVEIGPAAFGSADSFTHATAETSAGAPTGARPGGFWEALVEEMQPDAARLADRASAWRWSGIVGLFFIGAASAALVRFVIGLWVVQRYRTCSEQIAQQVLAEQVRQIASAMRIRRPIEVRQSRKLVAPATVGWRRPLILLPPAWEGWTEEERRVVLAHEVAHIARGDYPVWMLAQLGLTLHFYHPLVHWLARRLRLEQELAADVRGAELAGGRETYLVTLTRMVLQLDAPAAAWAANPFLPARGTFLRRMEMLSTEKSLRHVPWTRRQMTTFVAAMSLLGLIVAGVRVHSGERAPVAQPGEFRLAVAGGDKAADGVQARDDKKAADKDRVAEAKPTEKPLTLDELRPIVVDQIRSMRSLYVAYTVTDPAEFGGKSHDHIWAEQGFKLLKRNLPGKGAVGRAICFDGKQTYILGYHGDQPAGREIVDKLISEFYQTLQTSLIGWLHSSGGRESIVNAIRAPAARLMEATDTAPGPTIEIKNYVKPATKDLLDVTIVLDRAHGYLPQSIAYHSVSNPRWQFAYEVEEFEKVRDAATGEDRWFPARGRYRQQTPERGEQVWTTTISKLQINDSLPDDLFVRVGDNPPVVPGQEQQSLAEFEKAYHLDQGQLVKRIRRPYLPGRMLNLKKWWADAFAQAPYETTGTFLPMVYPEREGKLGRPGFRFTGDTSQIGISARELVNAVGAGLELWRRDIEDLNKLLDSEVEGDFVIRADAPPDKVFASLGQLLASECGVPVKLELREVEHAVVAVGGRIQPPFTIVPETVLELYAKTPQPGQGTIEQGTFGAFLDAVGQFVDPRRRVLNEVENSPYRQEKISWRRTVRTEKEDKKLQGELEARAVLDHLEKQTGLTFVLESRKFPTIFVTRSE